MQIEQSNLAELGGMSKFLILTAISLGVLFTILPNFIQYDILPRAILFAQGGYGIMLRRW